METHVSKVCSAAFYFLHNLRRIRKYLSEQTTKTLVHALITSRLDYCNSLLYGMPQSLIDRLQRVQNAAARLIHGVPKFQHITSFLLKLHWLPIKQRIHFKILILTFKAIHGDAPLYIQQMVKWKPHSKYNLRQRENLLQRPSFKSLQTLGDRSFTVAAPTLWNALPHDIRQLNNFNQF